MKTLKELENVEKASEMMIVGSGGSIRTYREEILTYIKQHNVKTIGVNFMTSLCKPDYHLWTNKQRYRDLGQCISRKSILLFGCGLPISLIRKHHRGDFYKIDYSNILSLAIDEKIGYKDGRIFGYFRTAGVLAIMIAHIMGSSNITVAGMDGFTLHKKRDLDKKRAAQHCYGKGFTDDATWDECQQKDKAVDEELHSLHDYGIAFKIITPTVFKSFHEKEI